MGAVTPIDAVLHKAGDYKAAVQKLQSSVTQREYEANRLETGLSKPSIFLGLSPHHRLSIPALFPGDIMHLSGLNITDLLLKLWRGTMDCDTRRGDSKDTWTFIFLTGERWEKHGRDVGGASRFLPGFFDRPPRNPAEKVSSGYKCWEFQHWFYGLAPAMLFSIMPRKYWKNFCKLVAGVRIVHKKQTTQKERTDAHVYLSNFVYEFEVIYVDRKVSRMHFLPQCMHAILHPPRETFRIGPQIGTSQYPIERTIGDLGGEIRQPSKPFANLAKRALRRAQVNGLKAIFPDLAPDPPTVSPNVPSCTVGPGITLLHPREDNDRPPKPLSIQEQDAITNYIEQSAGSSASDLENWKKNPRVQRWGRLRLPNGHTCRSLWSEATRGELSRRARNIKVSLNIELQCLLEMAH